MLAKANMGRSKYPSQSSIIQMFSAFSPSMKFSSSFCTSFLRVSSIAGSCSRSCVLDVFSRQLQCLDCIRENSRVLHRPQTPDGLDSLIMPNIVRRVEEVRYALAVHQRIVRTIHIRLQHDQSELPRNQRLVSPTRQSNSPFSRDPWSNKSLGSSQGLQC